VIGAIILTSVLAFLAWLFMTMGSGNLLYLWDLKEIYAGIFFSVVTGVVAGRFVKGKDWRMLNPARWFLFAAYLIGPFFIAMAKANFDVAYRVITGKIRPGIVRIRPNLKTDLGITMLANSITLTPGTLSVDVDENSGDLFVHWINVKNGAEEKDICDYKLVCGKFPDWIRRIAE